VELLFTRFPPSVIVICLIHNVEREQSHCSRDSTEECRRDASGIRELFMEILLRFTNWEDDCNYSRQKGIDEIRDYVHCEATQPGPDGIIIKCAFVQREDSFRAKLKRGELHTCRFLPAVQP
jgi:hypothetical protein